MVLVATQVKRRRGTNDQNDAFAGAEGEITVDLTDKELRVHDGSGKTGGFRIGRHTDRSNCFSEVEKRLIIDLSSTGTLIVRAGSKLYIPNGTFSSYTVPTDIGRATFGSGTGLALVFVNSSKTALTYAMVESSISSGETMPTGNQIWLDSANTIIKVVNNGSISESGLSLPICEVMLENGSVKEITRIFNGFGYVGGAIFVLPCRALLTNGTNTDGTKKSLELVVTTPIIRDFYNYSNQTYTAWLTSNRQIGATYLNTLEYNKDENYIYSSGQKGIGAIFTRYRLYNHRIVNFYSKSAFSAVDYNDTEYIGHQAMPSGKYIDLTLGASDSTYTAPADGWVVFGKINGTSEQRFVQLENYTQLLRSRSFAPYSSNGVFVFIPVCRGDIFSIAYDCVGNTLGFRFIYANGAK